MNETIRNLKQRQADEIQAARKTFTDFDISKDCWPSEIDINWKPVILEHARYICTLSPVQKKIITLYTHNSNIFQIISRPDNKEQDIRNFFQSPYKELFFQICQELNIQLIESMESVQLALGRIINELGQMIVNAPTANTYLDLYRLETASDYGKQEVPLEFYQRKGFYSYNIVRNCIGILNMKCPMLNCYSYLYYHTKLQNKSCCLFHHRIKPGSKFLFIRPASGYPVNEVIMHDLIMEKIKISPRGPIKINFKKIWMPMPYSDLPYVRIAIGDRCSMSETIKFFDIQETGDDVTTIDYYSTMGAIYDEEDPRFKQKRKRRTKYTRRKKKLRPSRKSRKKIR